MEEKQKKEKIRNIGIIAHIDAGKTTTTERILFFTGKIHKIGNVDDGNTTTDWMEQERERGITITSAAITCSWKGLTVNLIDTPGHVDFTAEVERTLRVLDGAVVVFCAVGGVEPQSETVWHQADKYKVPRIVFVNKMDRTGSNYYSVLNDIEKKLQGKILPMVMPIGEEEKFSGVVDIVSMKAYCYSSGDASGFEEREIPQDLIPGAQKMHDRIIDVASNFDDELMEKFVQGQPITPEDIRWAVRLGVLKNEIVPAYCGTSFRNKGVEMLLDGVRDFLPSPLDRACMTGIIPSTEEQVERKPNDSEKFSAMVFKIMTDPYIGRLCYIRVYSGKLHSGQEILNATRGKKERIGRIVRMHAEDREEINETCAGDIVAVIGLKNSKTGDTLTDSKAPVIFESIKFPEPVISLAIEPKTKAEEEKMSQVLAKMAEEDPTFMARYNSDTGQNIIYGMGELHLEIIIDRMKREFSLEVNTGKPMVAYKETIRKEVEEEGKYIRQTGGHGQYGHVVIRVYPRAAGAGFEFIDSIRSGRIPMEYIPSIERSSKETLMTGGVYGYPVFDVGVELLDGSYHDVDSSEIAYKIATSQAIKSALKKALPVVLEPIMRLEIMMPEEYTGDVISDISARRGKILGIELKGKVQNIHGTVPLSEVFGYATTLRSITSGRAAYNLEPLRYDLLPDNLKEKLVKGELFG